MSAEIDSLLMKHGYKIERLIGRGGFATCLRVQSIKYNQRFVAKAIKTPTNPEKKLLKFKLAKSYEKEINALCNIAHPNVLCIYDHFIEENYFFIILEYCNQGSLADIIQKTHTINPLDIMNYLKQIVSALTYCHSREIAHRDIKPGNILLHDGVIKVADFGIASIGKDSLDDTSGSIPFLAPEILEKKPHDPYKSDVWALGVTIYVLTIGSFPFVRTNRDTLLANIKHGSYEMPRFVNPIIQRFIRQTLVYDPNSRWSMNQLNKFINQTLLPRCTMPSSMNFFTQNNLLTTIRHQALRKSISQTQKSVEVSKPILPALHAPQF